MAKFIVLNDKDNTILNRDSIMFTYVEKYYSKTKPNKLTTVKVIITLRHDQETHVKYSTMEDYEKDFVAKLTQD